MVCKFIFLTSYFACELIEGLGKYKFLALSPVTIFYFSRALYILFSKEVKFLYQFYTKIYRMILFLAAAQLQLFYRAQYQTELGQLTSYLWPLYIFLLLMIPTTFVAFFFSLFTRLGSICSKNFKTKTMPYLPGNCWILAVLITSITSIILFTIFLGSKHPKDLEGSLDGNKFTEETLQTNSSIFNIFYTDLVIFMIMFVIGIKIKKKIMF